MNLLAGPALNSCQILETDGRHCEPKGLKLKALRPRPRMVGLIDWRGDAGFCMKKLVLITSTISMLLGGSAALSQSRACLRIMTIDELAKGSTFIGRVKVVKAEKINYRGAYGQLATVVPTEVIDGDFTLKKLNVLSKSNVQCAEDNYAVGQEMLVFRSISSMASFKLSAIW